MVTNNSKKRVVFSDLVVLFVFILIVFLMFLRSARSNDLYNSCPNPDELQTIIRQETKNTFLDPGTEITWFDSSITSFLNHVSSYPFSNNLLLYFNPRYPLSVNCSSCYETEPCEEDQTEPYFYPKQLSLSGMYSLLNNQPDLKKHFILIQETIDVSPNLPVPFHVISLFDLVNHLDQYPKDDSIFVLGSSYLETKIASETLVRNGYKRVYRVMTLLKTNSKGSTTP
ncbi:hypothetical protein LLG10_07595 [bacterium]|nr:hypothetical protein [bacterium]